MGTEGTAGTARTRDVRDRSGANDAPARPVEEGASRWRDPGRAIALSDGVLAIIITLLLLDLLLPEGPPGHLLARLIDR